MKLLRLLAATFGGALCWLSACILSAAETGRPAFLYSRHFNAMGETRYLPNGTYSEALSRLKTSFEVRVGHGLLTPHDLADVKVVLIANPSDRAVGGNPPPRHFSAEDITHLTAFVKNGGGLIIMGNQENHNLETEDTNRLLVNFGLRFANHYTDAKRIDLPRTTAVIGGLRWAYYTGNQIVIEADHPARPRSLVDNDPNQPVLAGTRNPRGSLLAVAEPGQGRVVLVTDSGWISNDALSGKGIGPVSIQEHDNGEIFLRLARWAAHAE